MANAANEQQTTYWNEDAGPRWVAFQERLDGQIEGAGLAAMEEAEVSEGERVLDVGCGCGGSSLELARRVGASGFVMGADLSVPMLSRARERAAQEGLTNVAFEQADAQTFGFKAGDFDVVFSRFGVMFFEDPIEAFGNLRRALRGGGRVSFVCWRPIQENPWILVPMMAAAQHVEMPKPPAPGEPGPFAFADPDHVRGILSKAGFERISIQPYDESQSFSESVDETLEFLQHIGPLSRILADVNESTRETVLDAVRKALEQHSGPDGVAAGRAMWVVRADNPA